MMPTRTCGEFPAAAPKVSPRVLVVDGDPLVRWSLTTGLRLGGFDADWAANAADGRPAIWGSIDFSDMSCGGVSSDARIEPAEQEGLVQMNVNGHRIAMEWRRYGVLLLVNGINMGHFKTGMEALRWCVALAELRATGPAQLQPEARGWGVRSLSWSRAYPRATAGADSAQTTSVVVLIR